MKHTQAIPLDVPYLPAAQKAFFWKKLQNRFSTALSYLALLVFLSVSVYPFLWMISSALKSNTEALTSVSLIPSQIHLEIITNAWKQLSFWKYSLNSLMISLPVVAGVVLVYSLAGYGFA